MRRQPVRDIDPFMLPCQDAPAATRAHDNPGAVGLAVRGPINGECRIGHIAKHRRVAHGTHWSAELHLRPNTIQRRRRSIGPEADDVSGQRCHGLQSNLKIPLVAHFIAFAGAFTWGDSGALALWANFIVGVDRVIKVFGCEAREPGLRRHPAGDWFGKSERAQSQAAGLRKS
jgi:hypothetical protein